MKVERVMSEIWLGVGVRLGDGELRRRISKVLKKTLL